MRDFICDRCKASIDSLAQARYVVQVEVHRVDRSRAIDTVQTAEGIDPLSELHRLLEDSTAGQIVAIDPENDEPDNHRACYELCPRCYRLYSLNPLGRDTDQVLQFSKN